MAKPGRKRRVFERAGGRCEYCTAMVSFNLPQSHFLRATIDHLVPLRDGGSNDLANLVLACHDCNQDKGAFNPFRNDPEMMERLTG